MTCRKYKKACQFSTHDVRHHHREDQHQGTTDRRTDQHHKGHLHVRNVGGHTRNQRCRRKLVDIPKGEALNPIKNILTEILCKSSRCLGRSESCNSSAAKREDCHSDKQQAEFHNVSHTCCSSVDLVDQICRDEGDECLNHRLQKDKNQRQHHGRLVFSDAFC